MTRFKRNANKCFSARRKGRQASHIGAMPHGSFLGRTGKSLNRLSTNGPPKRKKTSREKSVLVITHSGFSEGEKDTDCSAKKTKENDTLMQFKRK